MDWIGAVLKLGAWSYISHGHRGGFLFAILGNACLAVPLYKAGGLWGAITYCAVSSIIQAWGWLNWKPEN